MTELYNIFDDNDMQFEMESDEKEGHFISIYTRDCDTVRNLLGETTKEALAKLGDKYTYGDCFSLNFYTEYYPHTDEVAIHVCSEAYTTDAKGELDDILKESDNIKDGYIVLRDEDKQAINEAAVLYIGEDIGTFYDIENNVLSDFKDVLEP